VSQPAAERIPVLLIIHSLGHGGTERQVSVLAKNLDRKRYQVHVASELGGFRAEELAKEGIPVLSIPIKSFFNPGPIALSGFLANYIRQHSIRLVHSFDPGMSLVSTLAARRCRGVKLLSSQRFYMDMLQPKHRYLLLVSHWLAEGIVANSNALKEYLHRNYRFPVRRIDVCHNGIDTEAFSPEGRARLPQLAGAEVVIGSVCVLRPEKNLGQLMEAFARVISESPGARLLLMGSGPEEANLKALASRLGLSEACCFVPSGADVRPAMRSIDIFVNVSLSEGLPNAVMEAMACGCCVIASKVGGCPELITHGTDGLLTKPLSLDDLTEQLLEAVRRADWRTRMGAAASERMRRDFSVAASVAKMQSIYQRYLHP
jgi:glycosyltransferase involved in cell wall biosynthesis